MAAHDATFVGVSPEVGLRPEQLRALAAHYPAAEFSVVADQHSTPGRFAVLIVRASATETPQAAARVRTLRDDTRVIVVLDAPNLPATRSLMASGAADVLYEPVTEAALALSLERVFAGRKHTAEGGERSAGEVVALLKAGGGVGATSLGVQMGAVLSARGERVCFADLDVQWGMAAVYLDLGDALNVTDCVSAGADLAETNFTSRLAAHRSGLRLLAAPNEVAPLELLNERQADSLLRTLRQEMALTIVDLPSDWTAWTNQLLHAADRIVVVTQLTVGHVQLLKRQLRMLSSQQLDTKPVTLVCNAVSPEQQHVLPLKTTERALGRAFDVVIPDEPRLMREATNQGVELSALPRSGKLLKAVTALADSLLATPANAMTAKR